MIRYFYSRIGIKNFDNLAVWTHLVTTMHLRANIK